MIIQRHICKIELFSYRISIASITFAEWILFRIMCISYRRAIIILFSVVSYFLLLLEMVDIIFNWVMLELFLHVVGLQPCCLLVLICISFGRHNCEDTRNNGHNNKVDWFHKHKTIRIVWLSIIAGYRSTHNSNNTHNNRNISNIIERSKYIDNTNFIDEMSSLEQIWKENIQPLMRKDNTDNNKEVTETKATLSLFKFYSTILEFIVSPYVLLEKTKWNQIKHKIYQISYQNDHHSCFG